ncbi:STAS domain-containing protein [Actinokineospora sp.]|uniref:STAS domain-containing protein n=1 Tax=Actinokineospora sp. TaxID=1872133 RepID=UPI00403823AD
MGGGQCSWLSARPPAAKAVATIADPLNRPPSTPAADLDESAIPRQPARLTGHADLSTRPDFEQLLVALCSQAGGDVHLDMAELDFIDVSGVIILLRAASTLPDDRRLVLHNPPQAMRRILDLLGSSDDETGLTID